MKTTEATDTPEAVPAVGAHVDQGVRPRALLLAHKDGRETLHPINEYGTAYRDTAVSETLLYDQSARDCRLCVNFTTKSGGCTSTVQCVDSDQYKATAPRQYWVSGPNA